MASIYARPTPRFGVRRTSPPCSSTMLGVLSVELSTIRICPDTWARSRPSLHQSMNSPTVISSFIAGITMLNSTARWFALSNGISIDDRPRIHEHDFKIEQDKEHCDYIKLNAEARLPLTLGNHPAFIGGVFCSRACSALTNQDADEQRRKSKQSDNEDLQ